MKLRDFFKPREMLVLETEQKRKARRELAGLSAVIYGDDNALPPPRRSDQVVGMGEVPRSTDEARAWAFAADLVRRRGAGEASRIADLVVKHVQLLSREIR